jgi:phage/plasmid primase-like uncharacterized protein
MFMDELRSTARSYRIEDIASAYGLRVKRKGAELVGPCPQCGGTDRFAISIRKEKFLCRRCRGDNPGHGIRGEDRAR